jgi:UDP-glucose 4-epimerase
MTATIIGCNGYLGRHIAKFFMEKKWKIFGYDVTSESIVTGISYTVLKSLKKEDIDLINLNVDFIFYFAGVTGTNKAYDSYDVYIDVNEKALLCLINRMRKENIEGRLIFPSTRLIYKGKKDIPLKEDDTKEFKSIYALNKWFGENIINQYHEYFGINYNIFRICVPYGNLFLDKYSYGTIGFFLSNAISKKNINLFGTGEQRRTFTHVEDICNQIYFSIINEESINKTFNIPGENYSLMEIANMIAKKLGVLVENKDWPEIEKKMESGDTIFNGEKLLSYSKVEQMHTFEEWLNETCFQ